MVAFLADEDFDNRIARGLIRRLPGLDLVRVQDTEVATADDATILQWAFVQGRILLTHDVNTMTAHLNHRVNRGLSSSGVIFVPQSLPIGQAIEDLALIGLYSLPNEYQDQQIFLPLK